MNPDDARSRIIKPTQKALDEREKLEAIGEELEERLIEALSEDEYKQLLDLLKKLLSAFE